MPRSNDGRPWCAPSHAGGALARIFRALNRLVQSWWNVDRVRASPREGRILRLRPPAWILLDEREVEVLRRSVAHGAGGASVIYDCRTARGQAQIRVSTVGPVCCTQIYWFEEGRQQLLTEDQLQIWSP